MDDPNKENDKEFETFLRQFQLRQAGPLTESTSVQAGVGGGKRRWILAAAAVIAVAFLTTSLLWNLMRSRGPSATIEVAGDSSYKIGEKIAGTPIHAGRGESTTLVLEDGSRFEMRAQSEVSIEPAADGLRIRLDRGAVLVTAAEQSAGHLYVETRDARVSVVGTVFVVEARPSGTRIGVLHGEVEVRQREILRRLLPGEQTATDPSFEEQSLAEMIAWSRDLTRLRALLQQSSIASPQPEAGASAEKESTSYRTYKKAYAAAQPSAPQRGGEQEPPAQSQPQPTPEQPPQSDAGADGPGKEILLRACSTCHSVDLATAKRFPTREAVADRVAKDRQMGAGLSDGEASTLVDYLFKTYGAKKGAK